MISTLRPMRIAVSVVGGLCCVLVIVLWVRSYSRFDDIGWAMSAAGNLYLSPDVDMYPSNSSAASVEKYLSFDGKVSTYAVSNVQVVPRPSSGPEIPYGVVAVATFLFASLPWLPVRRFSLRTLLLATTAIAVALGLIIYATRG